jgi:hydroxyacylglutathione hydrolase
MKKIILSLLAVIGLIALALGAVMFATFSGLKEPVNNFALPQNAKIILDGYVGIGVIPAGNGVVLIDSGNDIKGEVLMQELKNRNLGTESVKAIFLTHGHPDHTGGAHLFPNAKIFAFSGDKGLVEGTAAANGPLPKLMGMPKDRATKVTDVLSDGIAVEVEGLQVKPFLIPGHTAGSAAYLVNEVLFLGDSAAGQSDGKIRAAPWIFSDDKEQSVNSVKALATRLKTENTAVKMLVFSHSGAFENADALFAF